MVDSLGQIHDEQKLSAISEPDIELEAIEVPAEGPMVFEFDVEVRPEFDLPQWKGLTLKKLVRDFTDQERRPDPAAAAGRSRPARAQQHRRGAGRLHYHQSDLPPRRRVAFQHRGGRSVGGNVIARSRACCWHEPAAIASSTCRVR